MQHATIQRTPLAVLAVLIAGCAGGTSAPAPETVPVGDPADVLTITVQNHQLDEARLTLWIEGRRERLGSVRGNSSETFQVPITGASSVRLEFDLSLGAHCITADVILGPGDIIEATIPTNLRMMAAVCR